MNNKGKIFTGIYLFLLLSGLAGMALVFASAMLYGPGISHDSVAYMHASKSLLQGNGFEYFGYPSPFIQWPPLLPLLLAGAGFLGIEPADASVWINAIAHGMIIFFSGAYFFSRLKSKLSAAFGTLLLVFSAPLLMVSRFIWTETLFVLFYLLFFINLEKYYNGGNVKHLVLAGIFSALACLDRYAGVTIIFAASLVLILRKCKPAKIFRDIVFYGAVSASPLAAWIARNYLVSSTLMGVRLPSEYSVGVNIKRIISSIYTWIQPDAKLTVVMSPVTAGGARFFAVLVPAAILAAYAVLLINGFIKHGHNRVKPGESPAADLHHFKVLFNAAFSIIYLAYLLASASIIAFEPINSRYLIPVYLPAVFIFIAAADAIAGRVEMQPGSFPVFRRIAVAVLGLYLVYPAVNMVSSAARLMQDGAGGYSTRTWHDNELIKYMRTSPRDCTYYSNNADVIYAITGVRAFYPPKKSGPYMYGVEQFKKALDSDKCSYIIWFKNGVPETLFDIEDIANLYELEIIEQNDAGKVYRVIR
ncbi:MAG: hypothetical protein ACM3XR_09960 [Bacillota bacterium]